MKELIEKLLNNIKSEIIQSQYDKGMVTTGESAASLQVTVSQFSGELSGSKSFIFQEFGRGPGKFPPMDNIIKWVEAKGLEGTTVRGLAYVIARKIAREGTRIFRDKSLGIPIETIIKENIDRFVAELQEQEFKKLKTML